MKEPNPTLNNKKFSGYKSFQIEKLKQFPEVQTWLKTISESSRRPYLLALKKFCEFSGKTPQELILARDREIKNPDPNNRTGMRDLILDFRSYLEMEQYAPKTINAIDGAVRSFFTAVIGKAGMLNVKNYKNRHVSIKKDLVPTLEELKKMLDVCNLDEKFRMIFIAQTGMRISDALAIRVGNIQRELDLEKVPLAISYLPQKDRESIGERITLLASDGVELLKQYLEWRMKNGEKITNESLLFVGRTKKFGKDTFGKLTRQAFNNTVKEAANKSGIGNGNGKYGRIRIHCLRKFFITQMTNHGVEDKIVNFFIGHKISDVDRVYWYRRVEDLRNIYAQRQQFLNPLNHKREYDLNKLEDIKDKISEIEKRIGKSDEKRSWVECYDAQIVTSEEEIIKLAKLGYDCQPIAESKWLMRRKKVSS